MNYSAPQPTIFERLRCIQRSRSLANNLSELVDLATNAITNGRATEAAQILNHLKDSILRIQPQLDRYPQMLVENVVQVKVLQKENCELGLAIAQLKKDQESILVFQEMLRTFDDFFAAAIADLDPDRE